ncbi:MAG TPA: PAS domain-containing protein [Armatimonadota bacterium]|jgi:PAS domain S-box-containing protein
MPEVSKSLWELLWDYDPNGLIVVDTEMIIQVVNPALCQMLKAEEQDLLGLPLSDVLDTEDEFRNVWEKDTVLRATEREWPRYGLMVREVIFPIKAESIIACIIVDVTHELHQRNEMLTLKRQTLEKVTRVVDNQMKVAQEIAGLLGESTAETKVSLLNVIEMLDRES